MIAGARMTPAAVIGWALVGFVVAGWMLSAASRGDQQERFDERLRLETRIRQAQKFESLGVIAAGIAHDINNQLQAIVGNAELIAARLPESERRHVDAILRVSEKAADHCRQLLTYAGHQTFALAPVQLNALIDGMLPLFDAAVSKKIRVEHNGPSRLPPVRADTAQIGQLVTGLVLNAAEAIGDHPGNIIIRTGLRECEISYLGNLHLGEGLAAGSYVTIEVSDDGPGMSETTLERVFDPFFTTKTGGRGLGMAAISGIARAHGAAIGVESERGQGAIFRIYFPAAPDASSAATTRPGATVLVVDDDEGVRATCRRHLERAGFRVYLAMDGRQGLQRFREHANEIDLVLLDLRMPRMDGREALDRIRRLRREIPVILTSGLLEAEKPANPSPTSAPRSSTSPTTPAT